MLKINTDRCIITKLKQTDIDDAINLFTDVRVRHYLGGTITKEEAVEKIYLWSNNKYEQYFTVRMLDSNDFIGIISITAHHDGEYKELSYQFLPKFWGKGIAMESIKAILEWLKTNGTVTELIAETQSANLNSCKLLERIGFELVDTVVRFSENQSIYMIKY